MKYLFLGLLVFTGIALLAIPVAAQPIGPGPCHSDTVWGCYEHRLYLPAIAYDDITVGDDATIEPIVIVTPTPTSMVTPTATVTPVPPVTVTLVIVTVTP